MKIVSKQRFMVVYIEEEDIPFQEYPLGIKLIIQDLISWCWF